MTSTTQNNKMTTVNSTTQWTEGQQVTAPLRYGGQSANMNISAINKHCSLRQVTASNPPQRKAANRYHQWY
jgi:hypothetical protein